jgi:hypothetical protein
MSKNPGDIVDKILQRFAEENGHDIVWWWLSFGRSPEQGGPEFLGVSIVQGFDMVSAALAAHAHGCNPGGDVRGFMILPRLTIPEEFKNRLLTNEECDQIEAIFEEQHDRYFAAQSLCN